MTSSSTTTTTGVASLLFTTPPTSSSSLFNIVDNEHRLTSGDFTTVAQPSSSSSSSSYSPHTTNIDYLPSSSPFTRILQPPNHLALINNRLSFDSNQSVSDNSISSNTGVVPSSWFSGIRSKIALFSMTDWLSQLGLIGSSRLSTSTNQSSDMSPIRTNSATRIGQQDQRSKSVDTDSKLSQIMMLSPDSTLCDDIRLTPTPNEYDSESGIINDDETWMTNNFWMIDGNGDPGRVYNDTLEIQHFGPLQHLVTIGKHSPGKGHNFESISLLYPTWCDKCGDFIWGFLRQASKCQNCNYTCHYRCRLLVTLDCRTASDSFKAEFGSLNLTNNNKTDDSHSSTIQHAIIPSAPPATIEHQLFVADSSPLYPVIVENVYLNQSDPFEWPDAYRDDRLRTIIDEYNATADGLGITLHDDGVQFSGYLLIHMNFTRPINVVAGEIPPTIYDAINTGKSSTSSLRTITSFFLPTNTVKTLHLSCTTNARQLIVMLLRKFKVADNPLKFALYEREYEPTLQGQTYRCKMTRLMDDACPLRIALNRRNAKSGRQFVLQENDTGDILWDYFEIPELENFLRILQNEEQQYLWQIRQRFNVYRQCLNRELIARGCTITPVDENRSIVDSDDLPTKSQSKPDDQQQQWTVVADAAVAYQRLIDEASSNGSTIVDNRKSLTIKSKRNATDKVNWRQGTL